MEEKWNIDVPGCPMIRSPWHPPLDDGPIFIRQLEMTEEEYADAQRASALMSASMKPKKPPPDLPGTMEWCCLRGDTSKIGVVLRYTENEWTDVAWATDPPGPRICHRYELKRMHDQPPLMSEAIPTR